MANRPSGKKLIGLALGGLVFVRLLMALIPVRLHIGPETTVIDSPLRADGTPDYAAYLNDEWSVGVTPQNNAAVVLIRAFGAEIVDARVHQSYFDELGIAVPDGPGVYQEFRDHLHTNGIVDPSDWDRLKPLEDDASYCQSAPWTADDFPEVAGWLDAQQKPLAAFVEASQRQRFYSPLVVPPHEYLFSTPLPLVQHTRQSIRLLMTQAMLELGRGNANRACELTLAGHRLSRLLSEHPTLMGQLFSYSIVRSASAGDEAIVLSGLLTREQTIAYREELNAVPPLRPMADVVDRNERLMALDTSIAMYAGRFKDEHLEIPPPTLGWMLDPNPVLIRLNRAYDEFGAALAVPDRTKRNLALDDVERRHSKVKRPAAWKFGVAMAIGSRAMISDYIGQITVSVMLPGTRQAINAEELARVRLQLTDVGYALATHNAEHGAFPDSLDALVPGLIPAVPLDPFTGDPLKYELKEDGFLLYSLGDNGLDDGGLRDGSTNADDIAFGVTPEPDDGD